VGLTRLIGDVRGPRELVLVRHGESAGNLADAAARSRGADRLDLSARDADVELSETGQEQAAAVGAWLSGMAKEDLPALVVSSPYRRAADTARRAVEGTGLEVVFDERLRERDLGLLDGLTSTGIKSLYPEEAERRKKLGKFYYAPPSGESWCDVALRVRSLLVDLREGYDGARVLLFTHQAVIMSFRYVLEGLDEQQLLEIDRSTPLANASVTTFRRSDSGLELVSFADTSVVDATSAETTHEEARAGRGSDGRA
jgi:broad specificity phosphatase PhoE